MASGESRGGGSPQGSTPDLFGAAAVRRYEAVLGQQLRPAAQKAGLEVADLLQETLRRALQWQAASPEMFREAFPDESSLQAWAAVVIGNLIKDHRRSFYGRRVSLQAEIDEAVAGVSPDAEQVALARMVFTALADLPKRDGRVLWLREVEGYSYAEIARELDVPEAQVSGIVHRARKRLRDKYRLAVGGIAFPPIWRRDWWRRRAEHLPTVPVEAPAGLVGMATTRMVTLVLGLAATFALPGIPTTPVEDSARPVAPSGRAPTPVPPVPIADEPAGGTGAWADGRLIAEPRSSAFGPPVPRLPDPCAPTVCVKPKPDDERQPGHTLYLKPLGDDSPEVTQAITPACPHVRDNPLVGCRDDGEPERWVAEPPPSPGPEGDIP